MSELKHYGTPRHSGRYPWGSGDNPYQRNKNFIDYIDKLQKEGLSEKEISSSIGISIKELRNKKSNAKMQMKEELMTQALKLKDKGYSTNAISKKLNEPESSIRKLLSPIEQERIKKSNGIYNEIKDAVDKKKYIDIGTGSELYLGISKEKMDKAISRLKNEGYTEHILYIEQLGTQGQTTTLKVLAQPNVKFKEVFDNRDQIRNIQSYTEDGGKTFHKIEPPKSIDSKRVMIKYGNEGGIERDGLIELRKGVQDISLGNAKYAQVRIAVDGTHYIKGMAIYSDDLPKGIDIRFNTNKNKKENGSVLDVLKPMGDDPENPFKASIKNDDDLIRAQRHYIDSKTGKLELSALNIVNEEGNWDSWSKNLASQMLSKQPPELAQRQLKIALFKKQSEFETINALTNPTIKKHLLEKFADGCDSAAVDLKAAAMPRQQTQTILPFSSIKETEVYATKFKDGEKIALIRYPHGGKFEIPILTVNNKNAEARKAIGNNPLDAIGINYKTAQVLSGADFDGDTVIAIPTNHNEIKNRSPLKGLKDFDPKESYPKYEGMKVMLDEQKQQEMGKITNLITDMTIKGADEEEICRAVKHSMVVIDAVKHELDYKRSYDDNGIAALKVKYQGGTLGRPAGASTLISKSSSEARVPLRKQGVYKKGEDGKVRKYYVDPDTGEKLYTPTGSTYTKSRKLKSGEVRTTEVTRTMKSTKMAEAKDAYELSSGYKIENIYADYANEMKALGNLSRKVAYHTEGIKQSSTAAKTYANEVASLKDKLNDALKNAPLERQAQAIADKSAKLKIAADKSMDNDHKKKIRAQELNKARIKTGAGKHRIIPTEKEWEAIQNGAISNETLKKILNNSDIDILKSMAMPKESSLITSAQKSRIKMMSNSGYTQDDIAKALGLSVSSINNVLKQ